jgi:hypothetical protein
MSRHLPIFTAHFINLWGMMGRTVGLMNSCMKDQGIHIEFKVKYNMKEILRNLILKEEENSTLTVDLEEEDEDEAWVEVEVRSFVRTTPN